MQYSQEHLKTMVYAEFGGQTECIMGNWKIENATNPVSDQDPCCELLPVFSKGLRSQLFNDKGIYLLIKCTRKIYAS